MATKYSWTKATTETINWNLYHMGYHNLPADKMAPVIKYIHGWQNMGSQKLAMGEKETNCKFCGNLETQHHYFACPIHEWRETIKPAWDLLKMKLQTIDTSPTIIAILSSLIANKFHEDIENYIILKPISTSEKIINMALQDQLEIGWKHMFMGRISKKWKIAQKAYWRSKYNKTKMPRELMPRWESHIIPSLIQYGMDLWEFRNLHLHGQDNEDQRKLHRQKIYTKAKDLLRAGPMDLPVAQRTLFKMHATKRLQQSTRQLERWISIIEKAKDIQAENLKTIQQKSNLQKYFPNHQPPKLRRKETQPNEHKQNRIQQDMRKYLLRSAPNVRYRTTTIG